MSMTVPIVSGNTGSSIDPGQLFAVFQASIQPDEAVRKQAESHLKELGSTAGFTPSLLQLSLVPSEAAEARAVQQAAAVYLKNFVEKHWETHDDDVPSLIAPGDKAVMRGAIVEAVVAAAEPIRVQLLTVVRRLVRSDFPATWGDALGQMVPLLQSGDVNRVTAGLGCLLEVVSWRGGKEMKDVTEAVHSQVFPILLQLGQQFLGHVEEPAAQAVLKTVLKCYFTAIQFRFSAWLMSGDAFVGWSRLSLAVIQSAVPAAAAAVPREEAGEHAYWKMKKWAFHIHNKLMTRYGNAKLDTHIGENADFARAYMSSMVLPVLQVYLAQAHACVEGRNPLPDRIVCILCDFFEAALVAKATWEALKPQADWLVQGFVFPRLCWREEDAELWAEDPHEFIRTRLDPFDDVYSPTAACTNLVVDMAKRRRKDMFLPILAFVNGVLQDAQVTPARKDGALYLVGSLSSSLLRSKKVSGQMEQFLSAFVLPELRSPHAHLRLRACWVVEQFDELEYKTEANAVAALSGVLACLGEANEEFPVRVAACTALDAILDNPVVASAVTPYLPRIVETILKLANEIELDTLSYVLEDIVTQFAEDMAPWAAQLCTQLRDTLMRSIASYDPEQTGEDDEVPGLFDNTDRMMAVLGMLGTITTLVDSMAGKAETMAQLETILLPMVHTIMSKRIMDVYEEAFTLLDSLMYGQKAISPALWALFELVHQVFLEAGSSYTPDMATTLDNYISYGASELVRNPDALGRIVNIIETILTDPDFVASDWVHGCSLVESIFLNCRGNVDSLVGPFVKLVMDKLADRPKGETCVWSNSDKVLHLHAILAALHYAPLQAVGELERIGATDLFLARLVQVAGKFARVHDKKIVIVALSALFSSVSLEQLPPAWLPHLHDLLSAYLDAIATLPKAIELRKSLKERADRSDAEDSGDSDDDDGVYGSSDKDLDSAAEEEAVGAFTHANTSDLDAFEDHSDFSDYDDDELEEDLYFETPLDAVDAPAVAAAALRNVALSQPSAFHQMAANLTLPLQTTLRALLQ